MKMSKTDKIWWAITAIVAAIIIISLDPQWFLDALKFIIWIICAICSSIRWLIVAVPLVVWIILAII